LNYEAKIPNNMNLYPKFSPALAGYSIPARTYRPVRAGIELRGHGNGLQY
jgi:hypothetical protein